MGCVSPFWTEMGESLLTARALASSEVPGRLHAPPNKTRTRTGAVRSDAVELMRCLHRLVGEPRRAGNDQVAIDGRFQVPFGGSTRLRRDLRFSICALFYSPLASFTSCWTR